MNLTQTGRVILERRGINMASRRAGMIPRGRANRGIRRLGRVTNRLNSPAMEQRPQRRARLEQRQSRLQERLTPRIERRLGRIDTRRDRIQGRLDSGELGPRRTKRLSGRLGRLDKRYDRLSGLIPRATEEEILPGEEEVVAEEEVYPEEAEPVDYSSEIENIMAGLFPKTGITDAQSYIKDTLQPSFDWAQSEGQDAMEAYFASRGLTGSGHESEQYRRFNTDLTNQFNDRALDLAGADLGRRQQSADRMYSMLRDEADRAERGEQNQFDNMMQVLQQMTALSPLQYGYGGAQTAAELESQLGQAGAGIIGSLYPTAPPASAFEVPAPFYPPFMGAPPVGPDTSGADSIQAQGDAATGAGYLDALSQLFAIFGQ